MEAWQQDDPRAFEALVARWQEPVARVLARLTGRSEAVPDLCQEVFLRIYHARPRYRENGAFSAWLYRIALNVARDAARRQRTHVHPLDDYEPADQAAPADQQVQERECSK